MSPKARILIIDDDLSIRENLAMALEVEGFCVDTAENGKEAIEKSFSNFYNLAIVDWRLPDIEGTELLGKLKETKPRMMKIMLTGYPSMENAAKAVNERAEGFLLKPVEFEVLLKKVKDLLKLQEEDKAFNEEKMVEFLETRNKEIVPEIKNNQRGINLDPQQTNRFEKLFLEAVDETFSSLETFLKRLSINSWLRGSRFREKIFL